MPKPKGGRGKVAPYTTRHIRVPEPISSQVDELIELYQNYLEQGGSTNVPPKFVIHKPVNNFEEEQEKLVNKFIDDKEQIVLMLEEALKLRANAGGAIKEKIREVLQILRSQL